MKRDIEFRGKRLDTGQWVYGYLVVEPTGKYRIYYKPFYGAVNNNWQYVDPETVGQLVGVNDKDGQKLYEGDVVDVYNFHRPIRSVIFFQFGCFMVHVAVSEDDMAEFALSDVVEDDIHKIGNIHDNPELLKP